MTIDLEKLKAEAAIANLRLQLGQNLATRDGVVQKQTTLRAQLSALEQELRGMDLQIAELEAELKKLGGLPITAPAPMAAPPPPPAQQPLRSIPGPDGTCVRWEPAEDAELIRRYTTGGPAHMTIPGRPASGCLQRLGTLKRKGVIKFHVTSSQAVWNSLSDEDKGRTHPASSPAPAVSAEPKVDEPDHTTAYFVLESYAAGDALPEIGYAAGMSVEAVRDLIGLTLPSVDMQCLSAAQEPVVMALANGGMSVEAIAGYTKLPNTCVVGFLAHKRGAGALHGSRQIYDTWSDEADAALRSMRAQNRTPAQCAKLLHKSEDACRLREIALTILSHPKA